jgi:hypothetical protein
LTGELRIHAIQDGITWSTEQLSEGTTHVVLWVKGLGANADRANVIVECNGASLLVEYVGEPDSNNARQVNAQAPEASGERNLNFTVRYAGITSHGATIRG